MQPLRKRLYNKLHYWVNSQSIHSYNFVMIFD
jgi:hypothetical protein